MKVKPLTYRILHFIFYIGEAEDGGKKVGLSF